MTPFGKKSQFFSKRTDNDIYSRIESTFHANRPLINGISKTLSPWQKVSFSWTILAALDGGRRKCFRKVSLLSPHHCVKRSPDRFRIAGVIREKPTSNHYHNKQKLYTITRIHSLRLKVPFDIPILYQQWACVMHSPEKTVPTYDSMAFMAFWQPRETRRLAKHK